MEKEVESGGNHRQSREVIQANKEGGLDKEEGGQGRGGWLGRGSG